MRRRIFGFLAALLLLCLCTGCGNGANTTQTVSCGSLSMTVPSHFQDLINQGLYSYADFAYGYMELVIVGEEMPFAELDGWTPSAAEYANAFAYANGIQNPVVDRNSFVTVYYEMPDSENNTTWGWLAAFYCYDSGIWSVQCRCPADVFSEKESDFLSYLYSVAIEAQ